MKSKEPGLNKRNRRRKEVNQTIKNAPREIPVSIVDPRSQCPAKNAKCFKCGKEGHYGSVCKSKSKGGNVNKLQTQPINASLNEDCTAEDYTPV